MKVMDLFSLKGKVALITGGGRGLGEFIAEGYAEAGADLILASRKVENCEETGKRLADTYGIKYLAVKCDVAKDEDLENLVNVSVKEFGRIDILVNNSGVTWGAPTLEYPIEAWDKVMDINVRSVWILTQRVANVMKEQGGGKIVNISSIWGLKGSTEEAHPAVAYNASKAAVNSLTNNLAVKLARYKINVNAVCPGFYHTDMMDYVYDEAQEELLKLLLREIPLGKTGDPDDIKGITLYLASKASDYMTGSVIPIDGGLTSK